MSEIKRLEINYKTDELFENFRAFGNKDLYMVNELNGQMIDFAKSFNMPIKAIGRNDSKDFFLHHGFTDVEAKNIEGHDVLLWKP